MDASAAVVKDDSPHSEASVVQGYQAPVAGSDIVYRHDDVEMTEAHAAKPDDTDMTTSDPSNTTATAGIDNTSAQTDTDAMNTSVPESSLEQPEQLPVKMELTTEPSSDAMEDLTEHVTFDTSMHIDQPTSVQQTMPTPASGISPQDQQDLMDGMQTSPLASRRLCALVEAPNPKKKSELHEPLAISRHKSAETTHCVVGKLLMVCAALTHGTICEPDAPASRGEDSEYYLRAAFSLNTRIQGEEIVCVLH
jgi:hypothetical protein